jgi:hypothetical protein
MGRRWWYGGPTSLGTSRPRGLPVGGGRRRVGWWLPAGGGRGREGAGMGEDAPFLADSYILLCT